MEIDVNAEVDRFFDPSSLSGEETPSLLVIAGGVCAGKTTLRRAKYTAGFVVLDAAEIFVSLCRGQYLDFPGPLAEVLDLIGRLVAGRAVKERRHIVTEVIGDRRDGLDALLAAFSDRGYRPQFVYVDCDIEEGWRRNLNRGDNISAHFTQEFHERWLLQAATEVGRV